MRSACVVLVAAGCSFEHGVVGAVELDATVADVMADTAPAAWSPPVELTHLSSGAGEDDASLTSDLLEIYFGSRRSGGAGGEDIWRATRTSLADAWSPPVNVAELNSSSAETTAKVTADGLAVFFTSTRDGDADFYFSSRASRGATWATPVRVDALSTSGGDWGPFARNDLLRVVWCAGPTVPEEALFVATRTSTSGAWSTPARVTELDEAGISECDPMEPHGRAVYFASARNGNYDIYRAGRTNDAAPYGPLAPISTVNTSTSDDRDPWVSADERYLVFASNRSGIDRLYVSTR